MTTKKAKAAEVHHILRFDQTLQGVAILTFVVWAIGGVVLAYVVGAGFTPRPSVRTLLLEVAEEMAEQYVEITALVTGAVLAIILVRLGPGSIDRRTLRDGSMRGAGAVAISPRAVSAAGMIAATVLTSGLILLVLGATPLLVPPSGSRAIVIPAGSLAISVPTLLLAICLAAAAGQISEPVSARRRREREFLRSAIRAQVLLGYRVPDCFENMAGKVAAWSAAHGALVVPAAQEIPGRLHGFWKAATAISGYSVAASLLSGVATLMFATPSGAVLVAIWVMVAAGAAALLSIGVVSTGLQGGKRSPWAIWVVAVAGASLATVVPAILGSGPACAVAASATAGVLMLGGARSRCSRVVGGLEAAARVQAGRALNKRLLDIEQGRERKRVRQEPADAR